MALCYLILLCFCLSTNIAPGNTSVSIPMKKYLFETICWNPYGVFLEHHYKMRDKRMCGMRCTARETCNSFVFMKDSGWCAINENLNVNKTAVGCPAYDLIDYGEITTKDFIRIAPAAVGCGPIPAWQNVNITHDGNFNVGAVATYTCEPCSYFPHDSTGGVITCGANGQWTNPICVSAADVGHTYNGIPVQPGTIGCTATYGFGVCGGSIDGSVFYNGTAGSCYCDDVCCDAGDCCFDASCTPQVI